MVAESDLTPEKHLLFIEAADQPINPSERRTSLAVVTIDVKNYKGNHSRWLLPKLQIFYFTNNVLALQVKKKHKSNASICIQ